MKCYNSISEVNDHQLVREMIKFTFTMLLVLRVPMFIRFNWDFVVFAHGNSCSIGHWLKLLCIFAFAQKYL